MRKEYMIEFSNNLERFQLLMKECQSKSITQGMSRQQGSIDSGANLRVEEIKRKYGGNRRAQDNNEAMRESFVTLGSNRDDENQLLRKIKQMKESLLTEKLERTNPNFHHKSSQQTTLNYPSREHIEPRVDNIDKINAKIHQILNCLHGPADSTSIRHDLRPSIRNLKSDASHFTLSDLDQRSDPPKEQEDTRRSSAFKSPHFLQSCKDYPREQLQKDVILQDSSNRPLNSEESFSTNRHPTSNSLFSNSNHGVPKVREMDTRSDSGAQLNSIPSVRNINKFEKQNSLVRGTVSSIQTEESNVNSRKRYWDRTQVKDINDYRLQSGKKLDDEIRKIQDKIKAFESEKQKLGVEFTPYSYTPSKSSLDNKLRPSFGVSGHQPNSSVDRPPNTLRSKVTSVSTLPKNSSHHQSHSESNPMSSTSFHHNNDPKQLSSYAIEMKKSSLLIQPREGKQRNDTNHGLSYGPGCQSTSAFNSKESLETEKKTAADFRIERPSRNSASWLKNESELKTRMAEGMEQRRRKLMEQDQIHKCPQSTIKSLVEKLCRQVRLDEELRNAKLWLSGIIETNKWERLERDFQTHGFKLSRKELEVQLTITEEQNNPFFSSRDTNDTFETICQKYSAAEGHWKENILKSFNKEALEIEGFNAHKLDLERKGHLVIEDFVRFLNMESGMFFRNRDLILVYRRMTSNGQVSFEEVIEVIGKKG